MSVPWGARGLRSSNPFTRKQEEEWRRRNRSALAYIAAAAVGMVGMSYAAVPLYRLYCQVPGAPLPVRARPQEGCAGLSLLPSLPGHGHGWDDGRWARLGADREHAAGEGADHQGHLQRGRALQHAVELQTAAERDLRECPLLPAACPEPLAPGVLTPRVPPPVFTSLVLHRHRFVPGPWCGKPH